MLLHVSKLESQNAKEVLILKKIVVKGNKKTKDFAVFRELTLAVGDTVPKEERSSLLEKNRLLVYNTGLFNQVKIRDSVSGQNWFWKIEVSERWYIFPIGGLDVEEQNTTQWLKNPSLKRVTLWAGVAHTNLLGRNDPVYAVLKLGYTRGIVLGYKRPFLLPTKKIDGNFLLRRERNREVIFASDSGKLQRLKLYQHFIQQKSELFTEFRKRFSQYKFAYLSFFFSEYFSRDSLLLVNPYFLGEFKEQQAFLLRSEGKYRIDTRDLRPYPSKGNLLQLKASVLARNFRDYGIQLETYLSNHLPIYRNLLLHGISLRMQYNSLKKIPYPLKFRLDKINFRGFQNDYIDGNFLVAVQQELRLGIIPRKIREVSWFPKPVREFPFGIYLFGFSDFGGISDNTTTAFDKYYKQQFLYSYGLGIDVIGFYDVVLRGQIIRNKFGNYSVIFDMGIYIH